ncbi:heavy metal-associated isoprenylated plant protein 43-like [Senna tora]|uniref:Heavy metal-associated isoprenylated plant protein 43-like n=1 Tax=Senna tora TaxID=362788 RepID=A0A834TVB4_9FABA|nr:heavy metal-associated isoprenylated plant protein 43-like [Senna tora]
MVKKTVLKVDVNCKKKLLKAVSSLQGVDKIEVDEGKGTLTVTGDADPYDIIVRTRKAGKFAQVLTIGPPPPPPKQDPQKKPDDKKPDQKKKPEDKKSNPVHIPHYCPVCHQIAIGHMNRWDDPNPSCSIL